METRCKDLLRTAREAVLQNKVTILLQPIISLQNEKILGYEILARGPVNSSVYDASVLIWAIEQAGLQSEFNEGVLRLAMSLKSSTLSKGQKLFINVDIISTVGLKYRLTNTIRESGFEPEDVVFELTERVWREKNEGNLVPSVTNAIQKEGFKVALDDMVTPVDFVTALSSRPDFVKLDMSCVSNMLTNEKHRFAVRNWVKRMHDQGIAVIGEGVDKWEKLHILKELGVDYGQGYLIGVPHPTDQVSHLSVIL